MFILQRQDVEIANVQHPKREQQIPILKYQDQTFRLISVFEAAQAEEAKIFWKDLTDNQGKFCVLLQEDHRHSVWGRFKISQLAQEAESVSLAHIQACLIITQVVYFDIEELLGGRQAKLFQKEITKGLQGRQIPGIGSEQDTNKLLNVDPLGNFTPPKWDEQHLLAILQETYRLGKEFLGNTNFASELDEILQDMSAEDQKDFLGWLQGSTIGKQWG